MMAARPGDGAAIQGGSGPDGGCLAEGGEGQSAPPTVSPRCLGQPRRRIVRRSAAGAGTAGVLRLILASEQSSRWEGGQLPLCRGVCRQNLNGVQLRGFMTPGDPEKAFLGSGSVALLDPGPLGGFQCLFCWWGRLCGEPQTELP